MTRLGAIFAGGAGRRFGSDKAQALLSGRALLDHVADRLRPQSDALVVVGRDWPGLVSVADRPHAGLGPLGALAGALVHARSAGFADVLTSGCDLPDLPPDLAALLGRSPAVIAGQPLLGLWPATLANRLIDHLLQQEDRSMRAWITASGARSVRIDHPITNINRREDLEDLIHRRHPGPDPGSRVPGRNAVALDPGSSPE